MGTYIKEKKIKPLRVLLVEDSKVDAHIIKKVLTKNMLCPCEIKHAKTMKEAEELLNKDNEFNIVLLDLGLPDTEGGVNTFSKLKKTKTEAAIIILTSKDNHDLALTIVDEGAEDYVRKSSIAEDPKRLCDAVDFAVCRHKNLEENIHQKDDAIKEKDALMQMVAGSYSVVK